MRQKVARVFDSVITMKNKNQGLGTLRREPTAYDQANKIGYLLQLPPIGTMECQCSSTTTGGLRNWGNCQEQVQA
jgi:hypothetical protein